MIRRRPFFDPYPIEVCDTPDRTLWRECPVSCVSPIKEVRLAPEGFVSPRKKVGLNPEGFVSPRKKVGLNPEGFVLLEIK